MHPCGRSQSTLGDPGIERVLGTHSLLRLDPQLDEF